MHRFGMILASLLALAALPPFSSAQQEPQISAAPPLADSSPKISARELRVPSKAVKHFNKGTQLLADKDAGASIAEFQKAIKAFPDFYEAYYKIGIAELSLQHEAEAQGAFEKAIDLSHGRYPPADFGVGIALCLQGQFAEAESAIRRGLDLDSVDADGYFTLAWVLFSAGILPDAEKNARQAVLLKADFASAYLLLAQIHLRQGDTLALVSDLDAYLRLDPKGPHSAQATEVRAQAEQLLMKQRRSVPVFANTPSARTANP
jgi:tetratricopeptide (TPR) repeat protein